MEKYQVNTLASIGSQAVVASGLSTLPHLYDVASIITFQQCQQLDKKNQKELVSVVDPNYQAASQRNLKNDIKVALQLTAPIGLKLVRLAALGSFVVAANPITLILGGAGIFLTGKKTLEELRRAFQMDPMIRQKAELAEKAIDQGDFELAEQYLKDAISIDVSPENPRNGDLYFQLGMLYTRLQRPRQALVSFAKASVLFKEDQYFNKKTSDGSTIKISKRGYTELMALNCLNAFALDDVGLNEWAVLAKDFGDSASARLENFAKIKDQGVLFGLFGIDQKSSKENRSLMAGVRFLQAKFATASAISQFEITKIEPAIEQALLMVLEDENLTTNEKGMLIIQQSQFYFTMAIRHEGLTVKCLDAAMLLFKKGCELLEDTKDILQIRAQV